MASPNETGQVNSPVEAYGDGSGADHRRAGAQPASRDRSGYDPGTPAGRISTNESFATMSPATPGRAINDLLHTRRVVAPLLEVAREFDTLLRSDAVYKRERPTETEEDAVHNLQLGTAINVVREASAEVVEVLQNCVIFNDGIHDYVADPKFRAERQLFLKKGEPMIFGEQEDKGLVLENGHLKVVKIGEDGITRGDILVHHPEEDNLGLQVALINMALPEFPVAMGVIRSVEAPIYDQEMKKQIATVQAKRKVTCMDELLKSGNTWTVDGENCSEPVKFFDNKCFEK
jgi:hypothetical protein